VCEALDGLWPEGVIVPFDGPAIPLSLLPITFSFAKLARALVNAARSGPRPGPLCMDLELIYPAPQIRFCFVAVVPAIASEATTDTFLNSTNDTGFSIMFLVVH
jgi:hypothetical protein